MKKLSFFAAVVIAAVAGTTCYNHETENELSDLGKANVKALASDAYIGSGVCHGAGPNMTDVWCYGGRIICCWAHTDVFGKD